MHAYRTRPAMATNFRLTPLVWWLLNSPHKDIVILTNGKDLLFAMYA
jgi:hypothetical protein